MPRKYDLTPPPGAPATGEPVSREAAAAVVAHKGASNAQLKFLRSLCDGREIEDGARDAILKRVAVQQEINDDHGDKSPPLAAAGLTMTRARDFITRLLEKPQRLRSAGQLTKRDIIGEHHPRYTPPGPDDLPAGHYALKNSDGQLRFYHVKRGTRNPAVVWLSVEHGPDETDIAFRQPEFRAILAAIVKANPFEAARLYGRHIGSCGKCHRRLTNRVSRLLDIGPVCGGHMCSEEVWADLRRRAREALSAAGLDPDVDVEDTDDLERIRTEAGL